MSVVKSNAHQVGQSATAANNFTLYQPSTPDGTVRLGVGNAGATTADVITASSTGVTIPSVSSSNTFGFKNRIINGGMVIDQRNAGASVTPTANAYTLDRWSYGCGGVASKFAIQQNAGAVTPPAGFTKYLGATSQSAYSLSTTDRFFIQQGIEGFNVIDLAWGTSSAKTITVSFWVRSSLTGIFGGSVQNNVSDRSYPFSYSIPIANTWTYITITIPGDTSGTWLTNSSGGIWLIFGLGVGSTVSGTASSWQSGNYLSATGATSVVGTNGATFYITGVQLEVGSQATSFDFRSYGQELALCQRYYEQKNYNSVAYEGVCNSCLVGSGSSTEMLGIFPYEIEKRSAPTITLSSGGSFRQNGGGVADNPATGNSATQVGPYAFSLHVTSSTSRTGGAAGWISREGTATCYIGISAEL